MKRLGIAILFAASVLAGCSSQDASNLKQDARSLANDAGQAISGMTLAGKVNTALALRKDVNVKTLHIEAKDGMVTVSGHVSSPDEKARVFDVVNNTVGVDKVDITSLKVEGSGSQ